ncbi:hypothetical protein HK098_003393, partial [Nowakowskiella sp. JEL0407]
MGNPLKRRQQETALAKRFSDTLRYFQEEERKIVPQWKKRLSRQLRIVRPDATDHEVDRALEEEEKHRSRRAMQEFQDGSAEIQKIEKLIIELFDLIMEMNTVIDEQQVMINVAEEYIDVAEKYLSSAIVGAREQTFRPFRFFNALSPFKKNQTPNKPYNFEKPANSQFQPRSGSLPKSGVSENVERTRGIDFLQSTSEDRYNIYGTTTWGTGGSTLANLMTAELNIADKLELLTLEVRVDEKSENNIANFDRLVTATMEVCKMPLFKAAFLSTVIFEYLFPITNHPYADSDDPEIEERLLSKLTKLHNVVKRRMEANFEGHLAEMLPLLDGFEYVVTKGSMNVFSKVYRQVVGDDVADAIKAVFRRNPKSFAAGPPTFTGLRAAKGTDELKCSTDTIHVLKAKCLDCGSEVLFGDDVSHSTEGTIGQSSELDNTGISFRDIESSGSSLISKFEHLDSKIRDKVFALRKDEFSSSSYPCREGKYYHDIFIRYYKREPKSEIVRDWMTMALQKINDRRMDAFHWFVDEECLEGGESFTEQFLDALLHAKIVFLIITEETLKKFNFSHDNVILEWEWALHVKKLHSKRKFRIQPLFIGKTDPIQDFDFRAASQLPVQNDLSMPHPHRHSPKEHTMKEVVETIFGLEGSV